MKATETMEFIMSRVLLCPYMDRRKGAANQRLLDLCELLGITLNDYADFSFDYENYLEDNKEAKRKAQSLIASRR